ncbi:hypothetical protein [Sorangium sp. So ce406]|uniref:hypothetical protein n=1 Tax=Sorangium sp. So ce406 TaxID=3133311 RepID=UPI003F5C3E76
MDLRIDRLTSRVHLASTEASDAWRARVDACSRDRLARALDAALPGVLASLGLGPEAEVAVATLRVRVVVRGGLVDEADIAPAWARAVTAALRASIEPLASSGGGVTSDIAVFPDRFAAELEAMADALLGLPPPWWLAALSGGSAPGAGAIVRRWIESAPERVPSAVAMLARSSDRGLDTVIAEPEARALLEALAASRARQRRALSAPFAAPATPPAAPAAPPAAPAAPPRRGPDAAAGPRPAAAPLPEAQAVPSDRALSPEEARVAGRTRAPRARDLVAACLLLSRSPSADISPWLAGDAAPAADPAPGRSPASPRDARAERAGEPRDAAPDSPGAVPPERVDPSSPPVAPPPSSVSLAAAASLRSLAAVREHPVDAGGLLFLVRRVARSPWLAEHHGDALASRLIALAVLALGRAFEPLSEARRRASLARQWPLVEVFAATRREPSPAAMSSAAALLGELGAAGARVLADAGALLDLIASELPPDLPPFEPGARAIYGARASPFAPGDPDRALAHLLLRPGRLALSAHRADLVLPARAVDLAVRVGGWDIDPGFVPHLGRVIRFTYEGPAP